MKLIVVLDTGLMGEGKKKLDKEDIVFTLFVLPKKEPKPLLKGDGWVAGNGLPKKLLNGLLVWKGAGVGDEKKLLNAGLGWEMTVGCGALKKELNGLLEGVTTDVLGIPKKSE